MSRQFSRSNSRLDLGVKVKTCEMHTCGMPVRIVESVEPSLQYPMPSTVAEKRHFLMTSDETDRMRRMVILEPRGHKDMFGAMLTDPDNDNSHFGLLFLSNEGYGMMCGHATIAVSRYVLEKGLVAATLPETQLQFDCPCGVVRVSVEVLRELDGSVRIGQSRFLSVPAFVQQLDCVVHLVDEDNQLHQQMDFCSGSSAVRTVTTVRCDIVFGGNFYALVSEDELGVQLERDPVDTVVAAAMGLRRSVEAQVQLEHHSGRRDLEHLFGVVVVANSDSSSYGQHKKEQSEPLRTLCVFGVRSCDRSPCGSGCTALAAALHARGQLKLGEARFAQNALLGSDFAQFTVRPVQEQLLISNGNNDRARETVIVEISGRANIIGESVFTYEHDDYFKWGFHL